METPASAPPHSAVTTASTAASVPISTPSTATTTVSLPPPPHHPYPDSMDSSPRSRNADSTSAPAPGWDPVTSAANTAGVDAAFQAVPGGAKLRLMCSYGGHIVPRPHDKSLCYVGGDTRIVVVDRNCTLEELLSRLSKMLLNGRPFTLKYQLPSEDLDSLITVSSEEDLDNMVDEYDRLVANSNPAKPSRIRLFLFPTKLEVASSMGPILEGSVNKSEDWFLNALNGAGILQRGFSDPASVNCLLGLEENVGANNSPRNSDPNLKEGEVQGVGGGVDGSGNGGLGGGKTKLGNQSNQDVHSVPDSPIIETTSSFGSTSSSPSLANLPPIRVHVEDGTGNMPGGGLGARVLDHRVGIEDQFAQMSVGLQKQDEGVAAAMTSQAPLPLNPAISGGVVPVVSGGEYVNAIPRVVSDDERSDHGGYRKPPQLQPVLIPTSLPQQRSDLPSPDSVSSDSSLSNANNNRQKPVMYQDLSGAQIAAGGSRMAVNQIVTDPASRVQLQQVSDSGYLLPAQYEQIQQQSIQAQQQQHSIQAQQQQHSIQAQQQQHSIQAQQQQHSIQAQHQQQQSQQPSQTQQQQFIHAGTHYVQHHPAAGGVPISYYPVYPPQQTHPHHHPGQMDQRYPVYYISAGQGQAYSIPIQQPTNVTESTTVVPTSRPQTPPQNPSLMTSAGYGTSRTVSASTNPKPADMAQASVYRTSTVGGNPPLPQLVRMATPQQIQHQHHQHQVQQQQQQQQQQPTAQQFVGYSQMPHHPSQSIAQASAANATYAYEYSDPAQSQRYFTQPLGPNMGAQYQTMVAPTMLMADGSAPNPNDNNAKQQQQQNRTSQAL